MNGIGDLDRQDARGGEALQAVALTLSRGADPDQRTPKNGTGGKTNFQ